MNNIFKKIFVINLERNADRREHVSKIMSENNIDFEFFKAVDGKSIFPDNESRLKFIEENFLDCNKWQPSVGQIGCWLSHVEIWKKIVSENISSCLILEDDITFQIQNEDKSFQENFNDYCEQLPEDWNLFMLGYKDGYQPPDENQRISPKLNCPACTHAYALKPESARILLKNYWPMRGALDSYTGQAFFANASDANLKRFIDHWNVDRCNPTYDKPLYSKESDTSAILKLKSYAATPPLIAQGASFGYSDCW